MPEVFLGGFYMGILVNFPLGRFFRPVEHRAQPPEHLCGTRMNIAVSAQIKRRKKLEFWRVKNSTTDSKAPNYRLITIL